MSKKPSADELGRQIGDTVRSALQSGDLTQLKNIGPVIENAVKEVPNLAFGEPNQHKKSSPSDQSLKPPPKYKPAPLHNSQPPANRPAWQGSSLRSRLPGPPSGTGLPGMVLGTIGMVLFGITSLTLGLVGLGTADLVPAIMAGIFFVPFSFSTIATGLNSGRHKLATRVRQYYAMLEQKSVYPIEEIAFTMKMTPQAVRKDIKKAIRKGMMPDIRMDIQETCVIQGDESYKLYMDTERTRKELAANENERQKLLEDPAAAALEEFRKEGSTTIRKIRDANNAIQDKEFSDKLETLETTTAKIFAYVEKYPEKLSDTSRFMNYYLPTTLKLVEKYQQYDEAEIQVPTIVKAKEEIKATLDTINVAFHNLLDSLYQDDTLDVSTDIEVLETMLAQEGLTGKKFTIDSSETNLQL